jgi:hypothetical protein
MLDIAAWRTGRVLFVMVRLQIPQVIRNQALALRFGLFFLDFVGLPPWPRHILCRPDLKRETECLVSFQRYMEVIAGTWHTSSITCPSWWSVGSKAYTVSGLFGSSSGSRG